MRPRIVDEVRALRERPFLHQGRGERLDCIGVVIVVARGLGLVAADFDITGYPPQPDGVTLLRLAREHMRELPKAQAQAGDIGVYAWGGAAQHFGVLVPYKHGGLAIVHALGPRSPARVIESRILPGMRLVAAFALPGVA